jgi:hypothetical protein
MRFSADRWRWLYPRLSLNAWIVVSLSPFDSDPYRWTARDRSNLPNRCDRPSPRGCIIGRFAPAATLSAESEPACLDRDREPFRSTVVARGHSGRSSEILNAWTWQNDTLMRMEGKVAVVTGGAAGIGETSARKLYELGARVATMPPLLPGPALSWMEASSFLQAA